MEIGVLFWVIFIIAFLIGGIVYTGRWPVVWAPNLLVAILIGLLGWRVFGAVVK
jgi:hypothetical protein